VVMELLHSAEANLDPTLLDEQESHGYTALHCES
jgi:hypothetical protein